MPPPKLAKRFISWFLKDSLLEEVLGDLEESHAFNVNKYSRIKANRLYWYQVINYLRPFAIRSTIIQFTNTGSMYRNYIKIGLRNFNSNRGYSFINLGGLAIGMMVAILVGLWVQDEWSYNHNHENFDRIGKLYRNNSYMGEIESNTAQVTGLGTLLADEYGDHFEHLAMVRARTEYRVLADGKNKFTQGGYFMQDQGPDLFSLQMVYGTREGLKDMNSIFLSLSTSRKFFGDLNPVGKSIRMDDKWDLTVTGVYSDLPKNSEFHDASYFAPLDRYLKGWAHLEVWDNYNMYIYASISRETSFEAVNTAIENAMLPHISEKTASTSPRLFLHPMRDWHLNSEFEGGIPVFSKRLQFVLIFAFIGVFVLALASINFINLSTARAEKRAKEVGIRKSIGSQRVQLIGQFLTESLITVVLSFAVALVLVYVLLPFFNQVAGKSILFPWSIPTFWWISLSVVLFTALVSGSYPAFYLSSLNPIRALKGTVKYGSYAAVSRKVLVIFQFTISVILLIGTFGIYEQIKFGKDRPVGYVREGLLELQPRSPEYYSKYNALRNELLQTQVVEEMGESNYSITSTRGWNHGFDWEGRQESYNPAFNTIDVTHEYGKTVGLEFIAGRNFSRAGSGDVNGIIINESALALMQLEDPIGQILTFSPGWQEPTKVTIIGVVKDMIKGSPFESTDPSVLFLKEGSLSMLYIRIKEGVRVGDALPKIASAFSKHVPSAPFDYKFADEEYNAKFQQEESIGTLAGFFCLIAVLISCLGLFGLSSYMAEQRTKEVGIRKVLGASIWQIWGMLSMDFLLLVLLSCIISAPVSYYFLEGWLENYEIRTALPTWIFVLSILGAILIALATVSFQSIKVALTNPTESLKTE